MLDTHSTATPLTIPPDEAEQPIAPPGKKRLFARHRVALGGILLISIVMNFYELGKNGFGSYYPAAIRSMLDNWHNFFFVAYDPGGFVSIDKPPVGFWLEAASAKIFGFNSVSILLPQALAGVLLLAISLSWVVAVDLTPASQRPYVGSTQDNSELSLALGYNGIQRLLGSFGGFGGGSSANRAPNGTPPQFGNGGSTNTGGIGAGQQPPSGGSGGGGGIGGLFDIGTPGPLRLFIQPLAGQIARLLPFALLRAVALAWQRRPRLQIDRKQQSLLLWSMWLLTMCIFFSVATFFHQYYFTVMAPAIAALFG